MSIEERKIKKELETIKKTKEKINKHLGKLIAKKIDKEKIIQISYYLCKVFNKIN